jgi:hypothetical protein
MTRRHTLLAAGLLTYHVMAWTSTVHADGGRLCASGPCGAWQVTVFGARPLAGAGPTEFSVYVQDAKTGATATEVEVAIEAHHSDTGAVTRVTADVSPVSTFYLAGCELNLDGTWHVTTTIAGQRQEPQKIAFDFEVRQLLPAWFSLAVWIGWPVVPIALFSIHQRLRRKVGAKVAPSPTHSGRSAKATMRSFS